MLHFTSSTTPRYPTVAWPLCLLLVMVTQASESSSLNAADGPQPIEFNRDVRPILSEKCFICHGPDTKQRQADLRLDVANDAAAKVIAPGQRSDSEVWKRISSNDPDLRMPPLDSGLELSAREIDILGRWIEDGAEYQSHWAFLPVRRPDVPELRDHSGNVLDPVDAFVRRRLQREEIEPLDEADRATLIRRLSLDLTGLPPTVAEVRAFLADDSDGAYERVVDRLLASNRYGEHMARFWLDAARYADTNGYQYDLEREQWVWRDWVINAFNTNMPFDQFTIEQMAGDLLPGATDQQKLATAFHRNHPITIEGGVIDEEYRTEYVVDRVVTTSTVWMGLTMLCGRCHDHKYDPLTQREFYQFFAFFNQVPERGLNGFDPKLTVESPLRASELSAIDEQIAAATALLEEMLAAHKGQLAEWEQGLAVQVTDQWRIVVPQSRKSHGGADLVVQPDQSILATGANPGVETYELILDVSAPVHAIRLEALRHESLANGSTGRASNGNFVLSEFQVAAQAVRTDGGNSDDGSFEPVKLAGAEADYSQPNYHISGTIDGTIDKTGWAIDGNTKFEDRTAVFTLAEPLDPKTTRRIRIQLHHQWGGSHSIGRMRIALAPRPLASVAPDVSSILSIAAEQRSADQQRQLSEALLLRFGNAEQQAVVNELAALRLKRRQSAQTPPTMVLAEMPSPRKTHILERGEYDKPRDEVAAGTPASLPPMPDDVPRNRLGLARWLVMRDNPLTARVTVNRFWQQVFGTGLVKTTEDFGSQGEWPSHPELLDWLAVEFMESDWDVKALMKRIVMSRTYRQSSMASPTAFAADPENRLLARGPRMRLDAETVRDSALFVSGLMSERLGGPSVFPYHPEGLWQEINNRPGYSREYKQDTGENLYRRSFYTFWKRTVPPPAMAAFDAPEREFCVVRRSRTNTPLQAFVMLNDPQMVEAARKLGERMLSEGGPTTPERLAYGFQLCTARTPSAAESALLAELYQQRLAQYRTSADAAAEVLAVGESPVDPSQSQAELAAAAAVGRVLLNLSEFVTHP